MTGLGIGAKILCRTAGIVGIGAALYDATCLTKSGARHGMLVEEGKHLEDAYFSSRIPDHVSPNESNIGETVFDLRADNPIVPIYGKIKGGINGFLKGLGNNLPIVACSAFAIAAKGVMAKIGAIGVGLIGIYQIARQGFGLGKESPMK